MKSETRKALSKCMQLVDNFLDFDADNSFSSYSDAAQTLEELKKLLDALDGPTNQVPQKEPEPIIDPKEICKPHGTVAIQIMFGNRLVFETCCDGRCWKTVKEWDRPVLQCQLKALWKNSIKHYSQKIEKGKK